jgi:hypothetical protein
LFARGMLPARIHDPGQYLQTLSRTLESEQKKQRSGN